MGLPSFAILEWLSRKRISNFVLHAFEQMSTLALFRGPKPRVPALCQAVQVAAKSKKICDLAIQFSDFEIQQSSNAKTRSISPVSRDNDAFQFRKRKSDTQGVLNEFNPFLGFRCIASIVSRGARWCW